MKTLKLHAGVGYWFGLFDQGTMHFEGTDKEMFNYLKKHTDYSSKTIKNMMDRSLSEWVEVNARVK